METNYSYLDAYNELRQIVNEIEKGDINIDELATKIKRASQLITVCKAKLTASENEVEQLLKELMADQEEDGSEPAAEV